MLKFASRVSLRSEAGEAVRELHREEAVRLYQNEQALHRNKGKSVYELFLPDLNPETPKDSISSNSLRSVYRETLNGGAAS